MRVKVHPAGAYNAFHVDYKLNRFEAGLQDPLQSYPGNEMFGSNAAAVIFRLGPLTKLSRVAVIAKSNIEYTFYKNLRHPSPVRSLYNQTTYVIDRWGRCMRMRKDARRVFIGQRICFGQMVKGC